MRAGQLIQVDWVAGAVAGALVLALHGWLTDLYQLPGGLVLLIGIANLAYACVSFTLARFSRGDRVPLLRVVGQGKPLGSGLRKPIVLQAVLIAVEPLGLAKAE